MKAGTFLAFLCCWFSRLFCAVDVYVFNVGQGNCIWVSMDVVGGESDGKKKVLIVDCGLGNGKAAWIKEEDFIVKLKRIGLFDQVCDYALWVTHLHADHFSLLEQNIPHSQMPIYERVEYVFAGVGGGAMGEMGRNFEYWPVSELPTQANYKEDSRNRS
ncbi:MAG: MBL fold metallo-hydrolase [Puniceicoccales bacterium]|jgi:glyoxylase-like metal-dependent hydrolase (beta-lactamase superfamily II)|nr:MBL fold metallo-hydrolase [Puniceicoccales bacterium]